MAGTDTKLTLMIVEDDHAIRDVMKTMCELWQFNVVAFKDGFEAMAYLNEEKLPEPYPNVALIDIRMPGPWGHEISARIREHKVLKEIGIVLMTAYELPGSDEETYIITSGADRLIFKPLPPMDELLALIKEVIENRKKKTSPAASKKESKQEESEKSEKKSEKKPKEKSEDKPKSSSGDEPKSSSKKKD